MEQVAKRLVVAGDAAGVGQELDQGDAAEAGVHAGGQFREDLGQGAVPAEFALLYRHGGQEGGHGLGVGPEMETVVEGHRDVGAGPAGADSAAAMILPSYTMAAARAGNW